jgi:hypothetical protein
LNKALNSRFYCGRRFYCGLRLMRPAFIATST